MKLELQTKRNQLEQTATDILREGFYSSSSLPLLNDYVTQTLENENFKTTMEEQMAEKLGIDVDNLTNGMSFTRYANMKSVSIEHTESNKREFYAARLAEAVVAFRHIMTTEPENYLRVAIVKFNLDLQNSYAREIQNNAN